MLTRYHNVRSTGTVTNTSRETTCGTTNLRRHLRAQSSYRPPVGDALGLDSIIAVSEKEELEEAPQSWLAISEGGAGLCNVSTWMKSERAEAPALSGLGTAEFEWSDSEGGTRETKYPTVSQPHVRSHVRT